MRAMIDGRVYDTNRAEEVARFTRKVDQGPLFCGGGEHWMSPHEFILYRTRAGEFFEYDAESESIARLTRKDARRIMQELDPDAHGPLCWGA